MTASERTDWAGREHPRAGLEPRIVSLVPSITELLFDLGLGPFVAGRTTFCVHPREGVESVPRVGGTKTVRIDRLRRLEPTHVIVNVDENRKEDVEALESFVPHVIVTHPARTGRQPGALPPPRLGLRKGGGRRAPRAPPSPASSRR